MLLKGYTIYDNKSLRYHTPWFQSTDGEAVRAFTDLVNDHNSAISRHPGDYSLWCMGTYDDNKGQLHAQVPLVHIVDATAVVAVAPTPLFPSTGPDRDQVSARFNGKEA